MRVTRLELDGVGPFDKATFEFPVPEAGETGELVLFEGPNGSGKTTLLMAIAIALHHVPVKEKWKSVNDKIAETKGISEHLEIPPFSWNRRLARSTSQALISISDSQTEVIWGFQGPRWKHLQVNEAARFINSISTQVKEYEKARLGEGTTSWAAYAFASHQTTPVMEVRGPAPIQDNYSARALLFGHPAILNDQDPPPLGQLLSNMDYERSRAFAYGAKKSSESQKLLYEKTADSYEKTIADMEAVLSDVLDRKVKFDFRLGEPAPRVLFDGQELPLDLLGEGLRSTFAWLSDLLIQLQLTPWTDKSKSPFDQEFWLLLDEVDQSLHPQMQMRLMPALRKLFKNARIYATTHSPFVVASAGHGHVFSIEPNRQTRRVSGPQHPQKLEPGQTLERIVSTVFKSPSLFIDKETQDRLREHKRMIEDLDRGTAFPAAIWAEFFANRTWLLERTEEVQAVVAMREVPVRKLIEAHRQESRA